MRIEAILLAWNDIEAALAQLSRLNSWRNIDPGLCLVDNTADAAPEPAYGARLPPNCRLILPGRNLGYAGGINAGLRGITAKDAGAVLLINNDVLLEEKDALTLIRHLNANPALGAVGPVLEETRGGCAVKCFGGLDPLSHASTRRFSPPAAGSWPLLDANYVPGTVFLFRSELLSKIGLLDEEFFFSGEIAEYCARIRRAGLRCAVALDATARHEQSGDQRLRNTLYRYYTLRNRFLLARRGAPAARMPWKLAWTLTGALMWLKTAPRDPGAARAVAWAIRDAWGGRFGNRNELFKA